MYIKFIKNTEKKRILGKLNEHYGITSIPFLLLRQGKERIRGYSGNLSKDEIIQLSKNLRIELVGLYLMKEEGENMRLSFDSTSILDIKKNILEITDQQAKDWLSGEDLQVDENLKGMIVLKNKENFLGAGKAGQGRITNFVPKDRRLKN